MLMSEKVSSTTNDAAEASQPFYLTRDRIPQIPADPALMKIQALGKKIPAVPNDLPEPSLSDNAWYIGRSLRKPHERCFGVLLTISPPPTDTT